MNVARDQLSIDGDINLDGKSVQIDDSTIRRMKDASQIGQHGLSEIARRKY